MTNGWTGGQYSVFRAALGAYLTVHFLTLVPWGGELFSDEGMLPRATTSPLALAFPNLLTAFDAPAVVIAFLLLATGASVLFAAGVKDRAAAVFLWYVWACLLGRNPLILNPGIPYVGWLLLAHALLPTARLGSLVARGRGETFGGWRMPATIFTAAWILMAVGYTYSGATKLVSPSWIDGTAVARVVENPLARPGLFREAILGLPAELLMLATWATLALELLFAPLALSRRLRPWIWTMLLAMHVGLIALIDFADLSLGMVMLHLFTFDPDWVPARTARSAETVFYDGGCGLCHRTVRFLLSEDRTPDGAFRFAPLGGATFKVEAPRNAGLPDSLIVRTDDGRMLTRARAVLHLGHRLGGLWRLLAWVFGQLPLAVLDRSYDAIARVRHRIFTRPEEACPIVPRELRSRLLA